MAKKKRSRIFAQDKQKGIFFFTGFPSKTTQKKYKIEFSRGLPQNKGTVWVKRRKKK